MNVYAWRRQIVTQIIILHYIHINYLFYFYLIFIWFNIADFIEACYWAFDHIYSILILVYSHSWYSHERPSTSVKSHDKLMFFAVWKQASGLGAKPVKLLAGGGSWAHPVPRISTAPHIVPEVTAWELHEIQGGLWRFGPWDRLQK